MFGEMNNIQLTNREYQVARLYAEGYVGKEIADIICASYRTVVNHTQNIYEKAGIPRCTNAISTWWLCREFNIQFELAPAIRKVGATALVSLLMFSMNISNEYLRVRRIKCRDEYGLITAW